MIEVGHQVAIVVENLCDYVWSFRDSPVVLNFFYENQIVFGELLWLTMLVVITTFPFDCFPHCVGTSCDSKPSSESCIIIIVPFVAKKETENDFIR